MAEGTKTKHKISLKVIVILVVMALFAVSVFLIAIATFNIYKWRQTETTVNNLLQRCNLLATDISDSTDEDIDMLASLYSVRILRVDSSFRVISDSYNYDVGKILATRSVIAAFSGKTEASYIEKYGFVRVVMPYYTNGMTESASGVLLVTASDKSTQEMISYMGQVLLITALIVFFVIMGVLILLVNLFFRPLQRVDDEVSLIAQGASTVRISDSPYKEYSSVFNKVNASLDKLRTVDDSRQEFVSNVSHELKTPMTSMKVLADSLLMQPDAPVEMYRDFMQDIVSEIDRENKIINDLLTLVKMDQSAAKLNVTTCNINDLIELTLKRLKLIAEQKNIDLLFESFRPVVAEVDEVKLMQAVTNLVENAIKYNVDNGWVRVSLNADHRYFYIKIADSGIGIPEDARELVFERFYRVDKARSRETGGTGLGLAITKNAVLMHRGVIKFYSKENEGTTFTIRIPLYSGGGEA